MEITKVKWATIDGYEKYEVSNTGLVREKATGILQKIKKGRRYFVDFCKIPISRLVALAFLPNPKGKPNVIHIDGVQSNNSVDNLRWATKEETVIHNQRVSTLYLTERTTAKKPVVAIGNNGELKRFSSIAECAERLGLHRRVIQDSLRHSLKQCAHWRFCYAL